MKRYDIINRFAFKYNLSRYLEIGVLRGECIEKINIKHKDGVDPGHEGEIHQMVNYNMTSNSFFAGFFHGMSVKKYDIVFIDGLHESPQVSEDIKNSLESTIDNGFVLMHDCNPPMKKHAQVPRGSQLSWNGDVYKSFLHSRLINPDHRHFVVDTDWGVGVILKNQQDKKLNKDFIQKGIDSWDFFCENKVELLSLTSVDDFKKCY
jgi:hypothetical protein